VRIKIHYLILAYSLGIIGFFVVLQKIVDASGLIFTISTLVAACVLSIALARPLILLAHRARQFSEEDHRVSIPRSRIAELQDVADAFNLLADKLRNRFTELTNEREEMQALIDCMAEGVIALSEDARVLRMNRSARTLLGLSDTPTPTPLGLVVHNNKLRSLLEDSVNKRVTSGEVEVNGRHLLVSSRPLDLGGAVATLLDISELRRLEQVRRDFVANASHELKTPLTSIRGYAETLLEDEPPEKTRRNFINSIRKNTIRLERLVEDLLDLSKLESGGWTGQQDPVDIKEIAREAWEVVSSNKVNDEITFDIIGDNKVIGDREGLFQVFRNLLENSVRHTENGGLVSISILATQDSRVEVSVSDNGEGISADALPRIFERFYRADSSRARDFGGTGLGLAIVRHLVSEMGGEVVAESTFGKGTAIKFTLPAAT
jgi:two-component system phosphate regulon sensor histidine kinase PhoR